MEREKLYLNMKRYEEEIKKHRGEYHPDVRIDGRKARLWVQTDLARIMGITPQHLSGVKSGHEPTSEKALMKLADAWGVNWKWLCGLSDFRTEEEERREEILSRFDSGRDKLFTEIDYMLRCLGVPVFYYGELEVKCRYGDSNSRKEISLSFAQFKLVRQAMNAAAKGALLSCFTLLNAEENDPESAHLTAAEEELVIEHLFDDNNEEPSTP